MEIRAIIYLNRAFSKLPDFEMQTQTAKLTMIKSCFFQKLLHFWKCSDFMYGTNNKVAFPFCPHNFFHLLCITIMSGKCITIITYFILYKIYNFMYLLLNTKQNKTILFIYIYIYIMLKMRHESHKLLLRQCQYITILQ